MNKLKTLTVGISAFNEEQTIGTLLNAIEMQTGETYKLEKVMIVLDGSTDNTRQEVMARKDKDIMLVEHTEQKGKATRLSELYKMNTSDILLILDADIFIKDQRFIEKLVSGFTSEHVAIVSSNNQPVRPNTFIGKVWYANEQSWYETRRLVPQGNHLYNNSGCAVALEKNFAKSIIMPQEAIADQQFVYLSAMKQGKQFVFKEHAVSYYLPPSTLEDIKKQYARSLGEETFLSNYFDASFDSYFQIKKKYKIKGFINALKKDPFYTIVSRIFLKILPLLGIKNDPANKKGLWKRTNSTKLAI